MIELPDYLDGGDEARLIPVGAATQKERFACSVLLASLRVVHPFARDFFDHIGWKVGSWSEIRGYTEPVFSNQPDGITCRPDGLLILDTGKKERRAIVETKIGSAKISGDQLAQYCRLAKANKIDAIITVSNELSADPTHLPYDIPKEGKNIPIFHWSWSYLVMLAELLLRVEEEFDEEQDYILREIIRYFDHESAGVSCNTTMCADWSEVVERILGAARLSTSDVAVSSVVSCWHQQLASVCISQTRQLKFPVTLRLSKPQWDQRIRLSDDISKFVESNRLWATFEYPAPQIPIELVADASRRNVTCRLTVDAPLNRRTYKSRIRWILGQLPDDLVLPARLDVVWKYNQRSSAPLSALREDLDAGKIDSPSAPRAFEIVYVADVSTKFAGTKSFIPAVEEALVAFYESIARHVRPWQGTVQPADVGETAALEVEQRSGEEEAASEATRTVVKSGRFNGRQFSIFDDGSIEIETGNGVQRFKDFSELTAAASAKNGHADAGGDRGHGPEPRL
jgi:hypothetical protein